MFIILSVYSNNNNNKGETLDQNVNLKNEDDIIYSNDSSKDKNS
jgi:hypothetical protein